MKKNAIKNLLVVEDNDTDFLLVQYKLIKMLDPEILERASNRASLRMALTTPRDLIVTDYHLTDIEATELLAQIYGVQPETPCIILTGSSAHVPTVTQPNVIAVLEKDDYVGLKRCLADHFGASA